MADYWCNHDQNAVVHGICECGTPVAGCWAVVTVTSIHIIDFDKSTVRRIPGNPDENWGEGYEVAQLRRDGETLPLLNANLAIGQPAVLYLDVRGDGTSTMRTTTPIHNIVHLTDELAAPPDTDSTS